MSDIYCWCGRKAVGFYTAKDEDVYEDGTATPYGPGQWCDACRAERLKFDFLAVQKRRELNEKLLEMPRPRLGERYRKEWVEVRKRPMWKPARERNRCKHYDGNRTFDRWTQTCVSHFIQHKQWMAQLLLERAAEESIQRPLGTFIPADGHNASLLGGS